MSQDQKNRAGGRDSEPRSSGGRNEGFEKGRQSGKKDRTSPWEWAIAALSAILVLGAIGFLLYDELSAPSSPPKIAIEAGPVTETEDGYVVEFSARNYGQTTAAGLVVEGELRSDTGLVETAQATIDYVPAEAMREGGLFFLQDPRRYTLEIRPKGYSRP